MKNFIRGLQAGLRGFSEGRRSYRDGGDRFLFEQELARHSEQMRAQGGKWLWAVFLGVFFLAGISGSYLTKVFAPPSYLADPGASPPWYFIRQDFFSGAAMLVGLVVILLLMGLTWKRYPNVKKVMLINVVIWMVPPVITSGIIYFRCTNFFDYDTATTCWSTFEAYSGSRIKWISLGLVVAGLLPVLGLMWRRRIRSL